jgi:DNA-binding transcriptional ArsR family regulator
MSYGEALVALSDPTRRAIVEALRDAPQPVGVLAGRFPVSRPAVSQHLKVLSDAGLVACDCDGTRRIYRLSPDGIGALRRYLDTLWDDALASYAAEAQRMTEGDPDD